MIATSIDRDEIGDLLDRVRSESWLMAALHAVAASGLPEAWIGAGAIRDVVWGQRHGGFDPTTVNDVDVVFFDPSDLSARRDETARQELAQLLDRPWEASNQAAVHTWYHHYFGGPPVLPFSTVHDAVATWPETASCVALRLTASGIDVCAPHGLHDLLAGIWRRNPVRVSLETSRARLARHRHARYWSAVTVVPPG
jgi:uncharacterized protein